MVKECRIEKVYSRGPARRLSRMERESRASHVSVCGAEDLPSCVGALDGGVPRTVDREKSGWPCMCLMESENYAERRGKRSWNHLYGGQSQSVRAHKPDGHLEENGACSTHLLGARLRARRPALSARGGLLLHARRQPPAYPRPLRPMRALLHFFRLSPGRAEPLPLPHATMRTIHAVHARPMAPGERDAAHVADAITA